MKKQIFFLLSVLSFGSAYCQTYNSPESIEFDYANNRWLIANNSGNNILARSSSSGALTLFATCSGGPHGIEIVNDTLYVCAGGSLKLFDLNTAAPIATIAMGATFLNGITHDNNYLYVTDFTAKKIYRVDIATRAYSIFVTGLAKSPNGIIYDQGNNRCVFVNWGTSAPIMAMDVTSGATSTIVATSLSNCDGIAKDGAGNYYVSSWGLNAISKFDNTFSTGPTTVVTGLNNPADIFYNVLTDTLGVPNSGTTGSATYTNTTSYHYFGSATGMNDPGNQGAIQLFPNPAKNGSEIKYVLTTAGKVSIQLYDEKGSLIKTICNDSQASGEHHFLIGREELAPGLYFVRLKTAGELRTQKLIINE